MSIFDLFRKKDKKFNLDVEKQEITTRESTNPEIEEGEKVLTIDSIPQKTIEYYINLFAQREFENEYQDDPFFIEYPRPTFIDFSDLDCLFNDAARLIVIHQQGSTSLIQRKFSIGYNRSGRIMDQLEAVGIVGPFEGSKARQVLIPDKYHLECILNNLDSGDFSKISSHGIDKPLLQEIEAIYHDQINQRKIELTNSFLGEKRIALESELARQKEDIRKELIERERIRELRRQVRKELIEDGLLQKNKGRTPIPQDVQDKVWIRDGGKCVLCGSNDRLEFDHIIPFSKGGSNSYRNIQLLCESCNRKKSNKIGQ